MGVSRPTMVKNSKIEGGGLVAEIVDSTKSKTFGTNVIDRNLVES